MNKWTLTKEKLPSYGEYLCYVKDFRCNEAGWKTDIQIEVDFDPEVGWGMPDKCFGRVVAWKELDNEPEL